MKKLIGWTLCLGLCLALLVCGALAEEAPAIHVQLDGQDLAFTDAVPQVKNQRTFLPFRAVFEAMGAEVDYEGSVITAVRGDKTLTMTLDQTAATLTEGDKTTTITMDVAPYVDPATWRTYVPVRFAAQALGCAVGWDQKAQTAIIIDVEPLLAQAMEGKDFTYLEKLTALEGKYDQGIWDMTAGMKADITLGGVLVATVDGVADGTVQDSDKMSMDMSMKMDMTTFMQMMSFMSGQSLTGQGLSDETQAMLDALKTDGVQVTMRGDMTSGKLYMNMDLGALAQQAKLDPEAWYDLDMAAFMAQTGMEWADVMAQAKSMDTLDMAKLLLASIQPSDAATGYTQVKATVDDLADILSDQNFQEVDGKRATTYALKEGDIDFAVTLALDMDGENAKGYTIDLDLAAQVEGQSMKMGMDISVDDQDKMDAKFSMGMGELAVDMTMEGAYTPGTTAPVTTPPEGATVVDYIETLQAMKGTDAGVIGGADGPTAIIAAD